MKRCIAALFLAAGVLFAQAGDWRPRMDQGNGLRRAGKFAEARAAYREALVIAEGETPKDPLRVASALNSLGMIEDEMGLLVESEGHYRRGLAILERTAGKQSVSRGHMLVNLSGVYLQQGQGAEAEALLREAVKTLAYFAHSSFGTPGNRMLLGVAESSLAEALLKRRAYKEAESLLNDALPALENEKQPREGYYGMALINLGVVRRFQDRDRDGEELFVRALARLEEDRGTDSTVLIYPLNNLAAVYAHSRRYEAAVELLQRALRIAEAHLGTEHPLYGASLRNYAECLKMEGRKAEGKKAEARAEEVLRSSARRNGAGMTVDVSAFRGK